MVNIIILLISHHIVVPENSYFPSNDSFWPQIIDYSWNLMNGMDWHGMKLWHETISWNDCMKWWHDIMLWHHFMTCHDLILRNCTMSYHYMSQDHGMVSWHDTAWYHVMKWNKIIKLNVMMAWHYLEWHYGMTPLNGIMEWHHGMPSWYHDRKCCDNM